ncbi:MAG: alpha-rhamnosidase [Clostridia bacterium]|nr:alpha-rhamnosidase [Clostridia bacterium]
MAMWIWHFGDFEMYHNLRLHMRRDEFDHQFPPFWRLDDCYHNVVFRKEVTTAEDGHVRVNARYQGMLEIDGKRYRLSDSWGDAVTYPLPAGRHVIEAKVMCEDLPCFYMDGVVETDGTWDACTYGGPWLKAGCSPMYSDPEANPAEFPFVREPLVPVSAEEADGGLLYDFGRECFGEINVRAVKDSVKVRFGESREEALSDEAILQKHEAGFTDRVSVSFSPCAFRYVWVGPALPVEAEEQLLDVTSRGSFRCSDERLNRIWDVSLRTFSLCSREFFLDGIKRDRWVWSGDAYQSYLINRYCFADSAIDCRTMLALRGRDPMTTHINTILDYSFYWVMSLQDYYMSTGDADFIRNVWPSAVSLMDYCLARRDGNGFAANEGNGWIFIDWAEMDKDTCVCAEQMLFMRALEAMQALAAIVGADAGRYAALFNDLREKVDAFFWDDEKGAYIDSYASGKRNVTRHANIFALLFGYTVGEKRERILRGVLLNDAVTAIRTPYFKFYELDALCDAGRTEEVTRRMLAYWGSMVDGGATSIWEEYSPDEPMEAQYGMYGDRFGKSLCHAWGASPIYLLGRWYLGVKPVKPGYRAFEVRPQLGGLEWLEGTVPVGNGEVHICLRDGKCTVTATVSGGTLCWQGREYPLEAGVPVIV